MKHLSLQLFLSESQPNRFYQKLNIINKYRQKHIIIEKSIHFSLHSKSKILFSFLEPKIVFLQLLLLYVY